MERQSPEPQHPEEIGYRVDDLLIDVGRHRVMRAGETLPLKGLSFEFLLALVRSAPNLVSIDALMERVWPGVVVSPETVSQRAKLVRDALGDDPAAPRYIAGVRGRGYRLAAPVVPIRAAPGPEPAADLPPAESPQEPARASEAMSAGAASPPAESAAAAGPALARSERARAPRARRTAGIALAAVAAVALGALVYRYGSMLAGLAPGAERAATLTAPARSIAVLPFLDLSPQKNQEYFTDGITEELSSLLATVPSLRVAGRTSAFAFKGTNEDLRVIGRKLGVASVVEGSVRTDADRLRIAVRLVQAKDGYQLWTATYERRLDDIFAIQRDIAREVVTRLEQVLASRGAAGEAAQLAMRVPTRSVEAYTAFLRGQHLLRSRTVGNVQRALEQFRDAIELDPQFARAHVGIALAQILLEDQQVIGWAEAQPVAEAALDRAEQLDPALAEALAVRAVGLLRGPRVEERLALIERALELSPNDPQILVWAATLYDMALRVDEQMAAYEHAYRIDPLSPIVLHNYALVSYRRGESDRAMRLLGELEALAGESSWPPRLRAVFAWIDGRTDERIRWDRLALEREPENPYLHRRLSLAYAELGDVAAAERHAAAALQLNLRASRILAERVSVLLQAGRLDEALREADRARQRFADEPEIQAALGRARAWSGDEPAALEALRDALPALSSPRPMFAADDALYYYTADYVYLLRRSGAVAEARRIATAFGAWLDGYWSGPGRQERGEPLWTRARLAAALGERNALLEHLTALQARGGLLPAWIPREPMFAPYLEDPGIGALLQRFEARRTEWRRHLAADAA